MNSSNIRASWLGRRWQCPQCATRSFSSGTRRAVVGPEHPLYVDIPEPPQQSAPERSSVKGVLPVPRNVFAGSPRDQSTDDAIATKTRTSTTSRRPSTDSREEWKTKMSDMRRQNLREGLKDLRVRQDKRISRLAKQSARNRDMREQLLYKPEREDERLTAPSSALDLEKLLHERQLPDPSRKERLAIKARNIEKHEAAEKEERMDSLHELYLNARDFIVNTTQLEKAIDDAFGTPENPVMFNGGGNDNRSVWAYGAPRSVREMLNRAAGRSTRFAADNAPGYGAINKERMQRLAEELTGGKLDDKQSPR